MAFCTSCGQVIDDNATVCPICGAPQPVADAAQPQQMNMGGQPPMGQPMNNQPPMGGQPMNNQPPMGGQPMYNQPPMGGQPMYNQPPMGGQPMYNQPPMGGQPMYNQPPMGQPMYNQPPMGQPPMGMPRAKGGKKTFAIIGAIAAALVIALICMFTLGGGAMSKQKAVKNYYNAMYSQNVNKYMKSAFSKKMLKAIRKQTDMSTKEIKDELREDLESSTYTNYGEVRNVKITDSETLSKKEVKEYNKNIKDLTGVNVHFSQICRVEVEFEAYRTSAGEWREKSRSLILYKQGFKWYVLDMSL